jgi:hypothetical protein
MTVMADILVMIQIPDSGMAAPMLNVLYSTFSSVLLENGRPEIQHF